MTDHSAAAELIAGGVLAIITAIGFMPIRRVAVATTTIEYTLDGVKRTVRPGAVVPAADIAAANVPYHDYRSVRLPFLRQLIVGKDERTSTSKTVALAWTYAIFFALLALIVAKWLRTPAGYNALIKSGLREEYFLFLGGPYAAAVLAKYHAQGSADKTTAGVGSANPKQLVTDDTGDVDLGDFQYILFNALALIFFLGTFIPHLQLGMPRLPSLLTGLALTSAGGYTAKQLLGQAAPALTSVLPTSAARGSDVDVWGANLIIPASVAPDGAALNPTVMIGGAKAAVKAAEQTLGSDHLTVSIPPNAKPGQAKLSVVRADGAPAVGPGGASALSITVE